MKISAILIAILLIIVSGARFVPTAEPYAFQLSIASIALSVILLGTLLAFGRSTASKPATAEAMKPASVKIPQNQAQTELVTLIGLFQEKGRFVDFLMNDITPYTDAQVGSVARAVHQGCKTAFQESFSIAPMSSEAEGPRSRFRQDMPRMNSASSATCPAKPPSPGNSSTRAGR